MTERSARGASTVVATLAVWAYAGLGCILFVAEAAVGPVALSLDAVHGIHWADLVAVVAFPAWAFLVSRSFWRRPAPR